MSRTLDPARGLEAELRAAALYRLSRIAAAAPMIEADPAKGPHATRKEIKKLRALIRLLRRFAEGCARAENERWRLVAASLAGLRQAAALVETVDRFLQRTKAGDPLLPELLALRQRLEGRLAEMAADDRFLRALGQSCVDAASAGAGVMSEFPFEGDDIRTAELLGEGALANWKEARKALWRARRYGREDDFHDLRKAVKRHAADRELLRRLWPGPARDRRRADMLGEVLGELNDVFVMTSLGEGMGGSRAFARLLSRMRGKLASKSLKLAKRVLRERPGKLPRLFAKAARRQRVVLRPVVARDAPRAA